MTAAPLPIDDVLGPLRTALAEHSSAVLVAPPAPARRRAPLALLDESWAQGKRLILLEPRRIAAARMAATHFGAPPYVNIGAMPGSAFAIARRYAGRSPMRSR
jgi:ATP-dependent helicase HrpB